MVYEGKTYDLQCERTLREFLNRGGKTGFVAGSDTHEGKPAARTAVLVKELTRAAVFDALRHRRNYAINHARIQLDFRINDHLMGEEIQVNGKPRIAVKIRGTAPFEQVSIVRDGRIIRSGGRGKSNLRFTWTDREFTGASYYYVRVIQSDTDADGNHSCAWSSPIWVRAKAAQGASQ